jgi:predicted flap endonuclease-1-like 5' DNA nuclease
MGKKASKQNADKVVERVNKEFEKTSQRIEKLMNDAIKQFDGVQNQVQEPVRKLLKEIDELREREVKRFTDEFDRRMDEFHELQSSVMERLGLSSGKSGASKKPTSKKSTAKKPAAKKTATKKPATKAAAKKPAAPAAKKATAKKPAAAAKPADTSDLTRVKGIGPATAKKMKDAGITDISQIANPSAEDQAKLAAFSSVKGFNTFSAEAKKVL